MKKITDLYEVNQTKLEQSFQDACANEEFKNYVYGLNIKEEVLMKYTSGLEDAFLECEHCKKCKNLDICQNKVQGYCYTPIGNENLITFSYVACDKMKKKLEEDAYKDNLDLFEMPIEIKNASFKDIKSTNSLSIFFTFSSPTKLSNSSNISSIDLFCS